MHKTEPNKRNCCTFQIFSFSTLSSTHPVDEKCLDEFDHFQRHQQTDGYQVIEQDDEGEEVEAEVGRPAIYQRKSF